MLVLVLISTPSSSSKVSTSLDSIATFIHWSVSSKVGSVGRVRSVVRSSVRSVVSVLVSGKAKSAGLRALVLYSRVPGTVGDPASGGALVMGVSTVSRCVPG